MLLVFGDTRALMRLRVAGGELAEKRLNALINTTDRKWDHDASKAMKELNPAYADWMVSVNYEVGKKPAAIGAKYF